MELKYDVNADGSVANVRFDGLDGCECVTSVKQALSVLQVENPAVIFTKNAKSGLYDRISDTDYYRMLDAVEHIALLWRYDGDTPENKSTQQSLNALTLLANAITMIGQMHAQLRQTPSGTVHRPQEGV